MIEDRTISPEELDSESTQEMTLRPDGFSSFIGQHRIIDNLKIFIHAALKRGEALDHVLFSGPPGLGKTTLSFIIAKEMGAQMHTTSGPSLEKKGDLAGILTGLNEGDVLFIDEIHRLNPVIEENLYPAMEDFVFDIIIGEGPHARSIKLTLPRFTLVGATTRTGLLTNPLRERFGWSPRMDFYKVEELSAIVKRSATVLKINVEPSAADEIARRSRGTPRIANRLLRRVRDFADVANLDTITQDLANRSLLKLEVDSAGFDYMDIKYLKCIIDKFGGGPVGLDTLAASIGEEKDSIEDVLEPFLLQEGFIQRTPRGRIVTDRTYVHLGLKGKPGDQDQMALF